MPIATPALLLSGGEGTVTLEQAAFGRGGRNTEFLLSLTVGLKGADDIWTIVGDTDDIDGIEDAAGAVITPDTLARMQASGTDPRAALRDRDSYTAFKAIGDVITCSTFTNVNDIRAILIA